MRDALAQLLDLRVAAAAGSFASFSCARVNCIASSARWIWNTGCASGSRVRPTYCRLAMIHLVGSNCHQRTPLR